MSIPFESIIRLPRVATLPPSGVLGEAVVLDSTGVLHVHNGTAWVAQGGGGGGGTEITFGTSTLDFGSGAALTTVTVTGQTGCTATSKVWAWIQGDSTAGNNAYQHAVAPLRVVAADVTTGGFTLYATCEWLLSGEYTVRWAWST